MFQKHCLWMLVLSTLSIVPVEAKGPKKSDTYTKGTGYSGKGVPSNSKSSKYPKTYSFPTQPSTKKSYGQPSSSATTTSSVKSKPPGGSSDRFSRSTPSKFSKQRPSYSRSPVGSTSKPSVESKPVQFPSRPTYSKPKGSSRPTYNNRPSMTTRPGPNSPVYQRPPTVFYPKKPASRPAYSTLPATTTGPKSKPTRPATPSRPATRPETPTRTSPGRSDYIGSGKKTYYPGLRPPSYQRPNNTIINRPTTVINQNNTNVTNITRNTNVTNVTNNVTNVNNWFHGNSWQNNVTINSRHWNGRPWWYQRDYHEWHHGHWHGRYYFRGRNAWSHIDSDEHAWLNGLVAWGLGNLVYRSGYQVYVNPYYSQPIVIGSTIINYSQPICVQRSQYENLFENDEARAEQLRGQAISYFDAARRAFYIGNLSQAYDDINRAVALMPDDTALHEFRALVLFSAGRFREAAEVVHAVLAVAPGWDWTTMSSLYPDQDIYIQQLRNLENYVRLNPRAADARFLLAYHYITMGYPDSAEDQLQASLILNPGDRLATDLLTLMPEKNEQDDQFAALRSSELKTHILKGHWRARRPNGEIELDMNNGEFKWDYDLADKDESFRGKYEITGNMMLLASEQGSQMVGTVTRDGNNRFTFRLLGASENDPGVEFVRR